LTSKKIFTTIIALLLIIACASAPERKMPTIRPTSTPLVTEPEVTISVDSVDAVAWSPDGAWIALGREGSVFLYPATSLITPTHVLTVPGYVESVAFSPDSRLVASGNRSKSVGSGKTRQRFEDDTVRLWEVVTGEPLFVWTTDSGPVYKVVFSPDGDTLASAHFDGTVRLWEVTTREQKMLDHGEWLISLAFNRNGRLLASAGRDEYIRVWDVDTQQVTTSFSAAKGDFTIVAFSPKRNLLASTLHTNIVVYDLETGEKLMETPRRQFGNIWDLAFSPVGTILASASDNKTVRLWELETGEELAVFPHHGSVSTLAFSPDGQWLLTGSRKQPARIWNVTAALQKLKEQSQCPPLSPTDIVSRIIPGVHGGDIDLAGDDLLPGVW
jgi:WD40 repeat protein